MGGFMILPTLIPKEWNKIFNFLLWLSLALYLFSMIVFPIFEYFKSGQSAFDVWSRWQSLNVGVLAFAASIIALNINHINNIEKQKQIQQNRNQKLKATLALLPLELSRLTSFYKTCIESYLEALNQLGGKTITKNRDSLKTPLTTIPSSITPVFKECIEFSLDGIDDLLKDILSKTQINFARLINLYERFEGKDKIIFGPSSLHNEMFLIAKTETNILRLLQFVRGKEELNLSPVSEKEVHSGFNQLGTNTWTIDINGFSDYIKFKFENKSDE